MTKLKKKLDKLSHKYYEIKGRKNLSNNLKKFRNNNFNNKKDLNFQTNDLAIIIPCYNHSYYIYEAYRSILNQSYKGSIKVVFIDDNSTDDTAKIIEEIIYNNKNKNIEINFIKNKKNLRQHGSLNRAINTTKANLIIILNDDDYLVEDCLEKIIETFKKYDDVGMVGGSSIWFEDKLPTHRQLPFEKIKIKLYEPEKSSEYKNLNDLNMTHSSTAFLKKGWESVGGYYPKNKRISLDANEDRDFQMRFNTLYKVAVLDYPLAYWRTNTSHGKEY
jgi:glycosyltransferase involved in cell wall biosynthesis